MFKGRGVIGSNAEEGKDSLPLARRLIFPPRSRGLLCTDQFALAQDQNGQSQEDDRKGH